jgi:diacylglycerol kinase (ATP)
MEKLLFVIKPASEIIDKQEIETLISDAAEKYKFAWKIHYTSKENSEAQIRDKISNFKPDLVVAGGGDGTINQVASLLIGTPVELGIIPAGSANGLAYNLNIPSDIGRALDIALTSGAKPMDVIQINDGVYCFHLSDIGINARVVKRFDQEGSKGLAGYGRQMIKELFSKRKVITFRMNTNGESRKYKAEMLVIANARSFGTGAVINPLGEVDDGEFEIIVIRLYPWWILFDLFRMFLFGKHEKLKYVRIIKTRSADIFLDKPQDMQADGEIFNGIGSMKIRILPAAIRVRYSTSGKG